MFLPRFTQEEAIGSEMCKQGVPSFQGNIGKIAPKFSGELLGLHLLFHLYETIF